MPVRHAALTTVAAAALLGASPAALAAPTTETQVVQGDGATPYAHLRVGPGWQRVVRTDLGATPQAGREARRTSLTYFAQLSDFQLADEESPARVEALDLQGTPFTAAWRPQEALQPFTVDQVVRQVNRFTTSRVAGSGGRAHLDLVLTTGDSADNQQTNEVSWVVKLLEGGRLNPNSGGPGYTGVQDGKDGFDLLGRYYDPDKPAGSFAAFPRYPGLMDRAQKAFDTPGLTVPSYVAFGNHDGTVQGNLAANTAFNLVATGPLKALGTPGPGILVTPDASRAFASRPAYMQLHRTGHQADAHGFADIDPAETAASNGYATYYAFSPRPGVRFVSLNTVAEGSTVIPNSDGNIDDPQFQWLKRELDAAEGRGELVVVFGHHPIRSLTNTTADEGARACSDLTAGPGCDGDPRNSAPVRLGADLQSLLLAHPSVVAYVAGHTHEHKITPFQRAGGAGGFWGIETASETDWPIQSRLLQIFDNGDGTLSLFGTIIDHGAAVHPPAAGTAATSMNEEQLASVARELSLNDPQAGAPGGEGTPEDRNVELLVPDPRH